MNAGGKHTWQVPVLSTEPQKKGVCTEKGKTTTHIANGVGADMLLAPDRNRFYWMSAYEEEKKGNGGKLAEWVQGKRSITPSDVFFGKLAKKGLKSLLADNSGIFPK